MSDKSTPRYMIKPTSITGYSLLVEIREGSFKNFSMQMETWRARQIMASVHACSDISVEALEAGVVKDLIRVVKLGEDIDFGGEPKTSFGMEYRKWLSEAKSILDKLEAHHD